MGKDNFDGGKGRPIVKYRDTPWSSVQKRLNQSRSRLGCGLGCAVGIVLDGVQWCWGTFPWQPILRLNLLLTVFVWTIATRQLVMEGVWVISWQNADITNILHLRDVAMATIFLLSVYGGAHWRHLVNTTTIHVWQRCSLMSNYFVHLFILFLLLVFVFY